MFLPLREYFLAISSNLENFRIVSMSGNRAKPDGKKCQESKASISRTSEMPHL